MKMNDLNAQKETPNERQEISRRQLLSILGSTFVLSACGSQAQQVNAVLNTPELSEGLNKIPQGSLIETYLQLHPEVTANYVAGVQRLRHAENSGNARTRDADIFEQMLKQTQPTMIIPNSAEVISAMQQNQAEAYQYFQENLRPEQYGIYIDGFNKHLYILEGSNNGTQAIRRILVTTGAAGFSNVNESGGTPLGAWPVQDINSGRLGQVMAYRDADGCPVGSFINTFQQWQAGQSHHACIVTEYISINGTRGIGIHGTNYELDRNGNLRMQQDASGGCIRCTNADIAALIGSGYVSEGMPLYISGNQPGSQTAATTSKIPTHTNKTPTPETPPAVQSVVPETRLPVAPSPSASPASGIDEFGAATLN